MKRRGPHEREEGKGEGSGQWETSKEEKSGESKGLEWVVVTLLLNPNGQFSFCGRIQEH